MVIPKTRNSVLLAQNKNLIWQETSKKKNQKHTYECLITNSFYVHPRLPRSNWNIVESGHIHHNPIPTHLRNLLSTKTSDSTLSKYSPCVFFYCHWTVYKMKLHLMCRNNNEYPEKNIKILIIRHNRIYNVSSNPVHG